jgi:lipopolysaccharide biosynthesis glycosyltransferase
VTASDPNTVHIAAAANDAYAMGLAVMLRSAASVLGEGRSLKAHVLTRRLSAENRERILRSLPDGRVEVSWIDVPPDRMPDVTGRIRGFDWITVEAYDRLLLPEFLPDLDKVIYLDSDLVVCRDPGRLWDLDTGDALLLAAPEIDPDCRYVSSKKGIARYEELGLREDLDVFNSGVMVLDLAAWRECHLTRQLFDYLEATHGEGGWHDQDALNAMVAGRWGRLEPRWNVTMHLFRKRGSRREPEINANPFVIHFNSSVKPWQSGFPFDCGVYFFRHLDETEWKGWRPEESVLVDLRRRSSRPLSKGRERLLGLLKRGGRTLAHARSRRRRVDHVAGGPVPGEGSREIRLFMEGAPLEQDARGTIDFHLRAGVDRVFLLLEPSPAKWVHTVGSDRVHVFSRSDAGDLWRLLGRFGEGHWCLVLQSDERLLPAGPADPAGQADGVAGWPRDAQVSAASEVTTPSLRDLIARLDAEGAEALECRLVELAELNAGGDTSIERIATVFRDPNRGRLFRAAVDVEMTRGESGGAGLVRSRIPFFRYRPDMLAARDLCAVAGVRLSESRGTLLHLNRLPPGRD